MLFHLQYFSFHVVAEVADALTTFDLLLCLILTANFLEGYGL